MKSKPARKEKNYKLQPNIHKTKDQFTKMEPREEDISIDNESTLYKFAKQNFGFELSDDVSEDDNLPSGKGSFSKTGNNKPVFDRYGMDFNPMNTFKNQVIPVEIHNISKSFRPNLATIRVLSLGTKCFP